MAQDPKHNLCDIPAKNEAIMVRLLTIALAAPLSQARLQGRQAPHLAVNSPQNATVVTLDEKNPALHDLLLDFASVQKRTDGEFAPSPCNPCGTKGGSVGPGTEEKEPEEQFMERCECHFDKLMSSYPVIHMHNALTWQCQMSEEFPKTKPSGFDDHAMCMDFAKKLTCLRKKELGLDCTDCPPPAAPGPAPAPAPSPAPAPAPPPMYAELCKEYYAAANAPAGAPAPAPR